MIRKTIPRQSMPHAAMIVGNRRSLRSILAVGLLAVCTGVSAWAQAAPKLQPGDNVSNQKPSILDQVGIDQRLNNQVPLDLMFNDENGQAVQLQHCAGVLPMPHVVFAGAEWIYRSAQRHCEI